MSNSLILCYPEQLGYKLYQETRQAQTYIIHHSVTGVFSIRHGDWKLIQETKTSGGWPPPKGEAPIPGSAGQLYDLKLDPGEVNDLYEQRPDIVEWLSGLLKQYRQSERSV